MIEVSNYPGLPWGVRWHLKQHRLGWHYFIGARQTLWVMIGLICLICLLPSAVMAVVLEGGEGVFYAVVAGLLALATLILTGVRQHLVFDATEQALVERRGWWRTPRKERQRWLLADVTAVVAPIASVEQGCQLEIVDHRYTIGSWDDTAALARFLRTVYGVRAMDRVTCWPETRPLDAEAAETPSPQPTGVQSTSAQSKRPGATVTDTASPMPEAAGSPGHYVPVWDQRPLLKLALAFPAFVLIGYGLSLLGG